MAGIKKSITELIGHTPLVELTNYEKENNLGAEVVVKLEYYNPNQSVKDRTAFALIQSAERSGKLRPGGTVVDLTSGNTGIALAAYSAAKGYKFKVYIQDQVSEERFKVIHAFGGETVKLSEDAELSKVIEETNGDFVAVANFLKERDEKQDNVAFVDQTNNLANRQIHVDTTGPEIWEDTDGQVDIFVAAVGTGGTLSGAGEYLRSKNPNIQIVGVEPGPDSIPSDEHPEPEHEITGVHPFDETVPKERLPLNVNQNIYDEIIAVEALDAYATARAVAKSDGLLLGESSGAAINAATQLAKRPENKGKRIVAITADSGLRYLSSGLFEA